MSDACCKDGQARCRFKLIVFFVHFRCSLLAPIFGTQGLQVFVICTSQDWTRSVEELRMNRSRASRSQLKASTQSTKQFSTWCPRTCTLTQKNSLLYMNTTQKIPCPWAHHMKCHILCLDRTFFLQLWNLRQGFFTCTAVFSGVFGVRQIFRNVSLSIMLAS